MKIAFLLLIVLKSFCAETDFKGDSAVYPEIGIKCPDFILHNTNYYPKKEAGLSDFSGKWLILDFWNKYCGSCVESFPKTNGMQKKFANKVQFVLVGIQDKEDQIRTMYAKYRKEEKLEIPCAFDSTLAAKWGISTCPHIIILDDKGIVQGITNSINEKDVQEFLDGQHPLLNKTYSGDPNEIDYKIPFDSKAPFLINENGGQSDTDFLYRSILAKWNPSNQNQSCPIAIDGFFPDSTYRRGRFQVLGATLLHLYQYAYIGPVYWNNDDTSVYGKFYNKVSLEIADSSAFKPSEKGNGEYLYSYSLTMPPQEGNKKRLQEMMKRDLMNYFGYQVSLETRKCPCWRLIATKEARKNLITKGGPLDETKIIIPRVRCSYNNISIKELIFHLYGVSGDVILDSTGINENIDITINRINFNDLKKSLDEYGLELERTEKEMKVLVIRDPPQLDD